MACNATRSAHAHHSFLLPAGACVFGLLSRIKLSTREVRFSSASLVICISNLCPKKLVFEIPCTGVLDSLLSQALH
jgi:hypothetical protein